MQNDFRNPDYMPLDGGGCIMHAQIPCSVYTAIEITLAGLRQPFVFCSDIYLA